MSTTILDEGFTATNGDDLATHTADTTGGLWHQHTSYASRVLAIGTIAGEQGVVVGSGSGMGVYYNDASFNSADYDVNLYIRKNFPAVSGSYIGCLGRLSTSDMTAYGLYHDNDSGATVLAKWVAGSQTILSFLFTLYTDYLLLRLTMRGNTISAFYNPDSTGELQLNTDVTDSSVPDSGVTGKAGVFGDGVNGYVIGGMSAIDTSDGVIPELRFYRRHRR